MPVSRPIPSRTTPLSEEEKERMHGEMLRFLYSQALRLEEDAKFANARVQAGRIVVEATGGWRAAKGAKDEKMEKGVEGLLRRIGERNGEARGE